MIGALLGRTLRQLGPVLLAALLFLFVFELGLVFIATRFEGGEGLAGLVEQLPGFFRDLVLSQIKDFSAPALISLGFHHPLAYVVMLGMTVLMATAPAADRESGLLELIVSRPVPRHAYLLAVLASVLLASVLLPAAVLAGGLAGVQLFDVVADDAFGELGRSALACSALMLATAGLTLFCATGARRRFVAVVAVLAILLPSFVVDFLSFLWTGLHTLRWLSLFHYVPALPGTEGKPPFAVGMGVLLAVGVLFGALSFRRWQRQDF